MVRKAEKRGTERRRWALRPVLSIAALLIVAATATAQSRNTCLECHAMMDGKLKITAEADAADIHTQKGLTCVSCHGGDASKEDPYAAMSRAAGYRGKIERREIPGLCANCHSDAAYIRGFNPSLRTDQLSQYRTSVHGKRLAAGDMKAAVCTDCHSVHGMRPASDTRSSVHPMNVAQTCGGCHANTETMKEYKIPTDQLAGYEASVHHEALTVRGDLSAPTCTTCHGNHGRRRRE